MDDKKYQIFISSTYSDLVGEREGIIKAILELYHIPIGMEMFSAEDEDQWEIIRRTIEVSDYYILVLGMRYGSKTSDNISFTQKEYEYALEKGIPILAFVMNDDVPLSKASRDDDLTEIKNFRNIVLKNSKMAQFWAYKDELIKKISISLMKQIIQRPAIGWVRGDKASSNKALSAELAVLSKENRDLRETVEKLQSQVVKKAPKIEISIASIEVDDMYDKYPKIVRPDEVSYSSVPAHLLEYITEDDINSYNEKIPSGDAVSLYNNDLEKFYKVKNYSKALVIEVSNSGTMKANNIYLDFHFPKDLVVAEPDDIVESPENPLPYNPLLAAENQFKKKKEKIKRSVDIHGGIFGSAFKSSADLFDSSRLRKMTPINQSWRMSLSDSTLTIKINSLLHTRVMTFADEYIIAALRLGTHVVAVDIICEEMHSSERVTIEFSAV
ncbi:DUF4062 domain-containing protein [Pseudomonas sp. TB1-B1]|uniref:DUF4062 domain-containing protein n=1 Tax=Pseudomonas sp. TB1-B1 TaxID=2985515 RepID=UPI0022715B35|nr:DUF4062 domain-containing protein [Pseudomonas sp. TB1-B1]MCX9153162.1 DUF4062 domain-containing protein [Pseudomonas sp. TB1-B1]